MKNKSFEEGWSDVNTGTPLINQEPAAWQIWWVEPGGELPDSNDVAAGIPEMVHKHANQLPDNEKPGALGALILDGNYVYKIFHAGAAFGAGLYQHVNGLVPGTEVTVTVPVNLHRHNDDDPWGAEIGLFLNGQGRWWNQELLDNQWYGASWTGYADDFGAVDVEIVVKSKWDTPKDFFIDDINFDGTFADNPPPPPSGQELVVNIPEWATKVVFKE